MTFGKTTVWLDVTDDALEAVVVVRGTITRSHVVESPSGWNNEQLAAVFLAAIEELDAANARVDVFWRREGATATVVQVPVSGRAAPGAAMLTLIESGVIEPVRQAVEAHVLAPANDGGSHVLISAVDQRRIDWIHETIKAAGATPGRVFAGEAFAACAVIRASSSHQETEPVASIALGETVSAISVSTADGVQLVRFADIGIFPLRESYASALDGADEHSGTRAVEASRLLLDGVGIPRPEEAIVPGVAGADVLRAMQPALQRIAVELKQSIRFTLDVSERSRVFLRLVGPARCIRHLNHLLAEQIEAEDLPCPDSESQSKGSWLAFVGGAGASGWDGVALGNAGAESGAVSVKPFWSGVAAAILVLVGIGALAQSTTTKIAVEAREVRAELDGREGIEVSTEDVDTSRAISAATEALDSKLATRADFGAVLRLLAETATDGVGVESLSGQRSKDGTSLRLRAKASGADAQEARQTLQAFIVKLNSSPLTANVEIGSVRMIDEPSITYATFDATIALNETTAAWLTEEAMR